MRFFFTSVLAVALLAARPAVVAEPIFGIDEVATAGATTAPVGALHLAEWPGTAPWPGATALLGALPEPGTSAFRPSSVALARLASRVDGVLDEARWRRSTFGVLVVDGETGDTVYARGADEAMAPASNLKVLTTAAALHYLGPDFRWSTWVTTEAPVVDGVVQGDLVLYGTGDPGLSPSSRGQAGALDRLADSLAARGIRRVEGRVLGDASYFSGVTRRDEWDPRDLNDWFAAASSALGYNENMVQLRVEATAPGLPPVVHFDPPVSGVEIDNRARTVSGRPSSRLHVLRDDPSEPIRIEGEIAASARDVYRSMTVRDPDEFAAHAFTGALESAGITVTGRPGTVGDPDESALSASRIFTGATHRVLAGHRSEPLTEALARVNQESHNLYADLVLKTLGRVVLGDGSFEGGAQVVRMYLRDAVGVDPASLAMFDGSGLAAANRTTPGVLVATLRHAFASPLGSIYFETLPEAGTSRMRRMARTPAALNLRAKTGTIEGVSALSGMVRSADGRPLIFSIIGNDLPSSWGAKRLEDDIGATLAAWSAAP
ncbi:D-alanyl-D-alanine carboxypeptidase/D-alanyl-D-alanine-endopeptidase [Gaopeijia maritima]|uniref:D-alanyl-D-alanine carboxypeptidase/D-alanyl-D-alanine endopeptidase n=1 Tax=Gaopeijia maritima TaxID=3119007 RepID=UPI00324B4DC6